MNKIKIQINISRQVFAVIEERQIAPRPKWYFVIQEVGVWLLGIATTVLGAVAFSTVLFVLATAPFQYQSATHTNIFQFWIEVIPIFWLVLFVCFIFATDFFLRKTKKGYRHSFVVLTLSSMTISLVLGYAGFVAGIGEVIEKDFSQKIPFHTPIHIVARNMLNDPDKGLITGRLGESNSVFITSQGKTFVLNLDELPNLQKDLLQPNELVGLIGTSTNPNIFAVCAVIPLERLGHVLDSKLFERNELEERTNVCKGVRPYMRLKNNFLK